MRDKSRLIIVSLALGVLAIFVAASLFRYSVVTEKPDIIRLDRWTGKVRVCNADRCEDLVKGFAA